MATDNSPSSPDGTRAENSIRPSKKLRKDSAKPESPAAQPSSSTPSKPIAEHPVPEEVRRRFVQVKNRYYFPDGARAFTDRGTRLTTSSENTEVIRSLVQIAEARGWTEVTVRGTDRFRKEAWFAARTAGIGVRGYRPSEFEQEHLVRTFGRQGAAPAEDSVAAGSRSAPEPDTRAPEKRGGLLTGRLVEHGPASYRHDPHEAMSYFVKIETARGDRTIWGIDLERAFKESFTKPEVGDEVGLRPVRQEAVKVRTQKRDERGELVERDLETHRNRWILEKQAFFEARADAARTVRDASIDPKQAVKNHPELVGTYLQVRAAELAAKQFRDPQDRERFLHQVRSALADSVARGEPLPAVRLRERAPKAPEREAAPVRG